ncbi:hypothetical protein YC2023_054508 [Brassica napus]
MIDALDVLSLVTCIEKRYNRKKKEQYAVPCANLRLAIVCLNFEVISTLGDTYLGGDESDDFDKPVRQPRSEAPPIQSKRERERETLKFQFSVCDRFAYFRLQSSSSKNKNPSFLPSM